MARSAPPRVLGALSPPLRLPAIRTTSAVRCAFSSAHAAPHAPIIVSMLPPLPLAARTSAPPTSRAASPQASRARTAWTLVFTRTCLARTSPRAAGAPRLTDAG
ncbi:hypothetical protein C8R44DRAFT_991757 [Mycena epipterygia]|nr:hypothetical protein C8R44DRAFT_991757 [Mycena epipterygia]